MAGREAVQHADSDAGCRLRRRDSGLNLDPKTLDFRVRVRVGVVLSHGRGIGLVTDGKPR